MKQESNLNSRNNDTKGNGLHMETRAPNFFSGMLSQGKEGMKS